MSGPCCLSLALSCKLERAALELHAAILAISVYHPPMAQLDRYTVAISMTLLVEAPTERAAIELAKAKVNASDLEQFAYEIGDPWILPNR